MAPRKWTRCKMPKELLVKGFSGPASQSGSYLLAFKKHILFWDTRLFVHQEGDCYQEFGNGYDLRPTRTSGAFGFGALEEHEAQIWANFSIMHHGSINCSILHGMDRNPPTPDDGDPRV